MVQVTPADRQALLNLILEVSFEKREVTLASGQKSNFYLDLRQTLMRPKGVSLAGRLVLDLLQTGPPVEAVGGMAVGAVPLVSAVLAAAASAGVVDQLENVCMGEKAENVASQRSARGSAQGSVQRSIGGRRGAEPSRDPNRGRVRTTTMYGVPTRSSTSMLPVSGAEPVSERCEGRCEWR